MVRIEMKAKEIKKKESNDCLGHGVGLRAEHFQTIFDLKPRVDWFEAISENFMDTQGRPLAVLEKIRMDYPVGLHGTSLSIGSVSGLDSSYLKKLKELVERIQPEIVSDHLCWSDHHGARLFDLLPLPFTEESLALAVRHLDQLQSFLKRQFLIENVSAYVTFKHSQMTEWAFLNEIAKRSGCGILLDVNNIFVNSFNHGFDPLDYLAGISPEHVRQYHISGHTDMGKFLFDTHTGDVTQPVWNLYSEAVRRFGDCSALIEWDSEIKGLEELLALNDKSRDVARRSLEGLPQSKLEKTESVKKRTLKLSEAPIMLADIQRLFADEILTQGGHQGLAKTLNEQAGAPGIERLSVYAGGYPARIKEALLEAFPATRKILGERQFSERAVLFSKSRTFEHYNLNRVAEYFPAFIRTEKALPALPFLGDLAELELAAHRSFHADVNPPVTAEQFMELSGSVDPAKLTFKFQEHLFCVCSAWPIIDLWNARKTPVDKINIRIEKNPQSALVYRSGHQVLCLSLETRQSEFLLDLMAGLPLLRALEKLEDSDDAFSLRQWFSDWMNYQLITGFEIKSTRRVKRSRAPQRV